MLRVAMGRQHHIDSRLRTMRPASRASPFPAFQNADITGQPRVDSPRQPCALPRCVDRSKATPQTACRSVLIGTSAAGLLD